MKYRAKYVAQVVEYLPSMHKALGSIISLHNSHGVHAYKPITPETEA